MTLNAYGLECLAWPLTALGVIVIVLFVVRMLGVLGGEAIELPEELHD